MSYLKEFTIRNQKIQFPIYLPDATRGVIRGLDSESLKKVGIEGIVINTYHLMTQPGIELLKKVGSVKRFMGWEGWVASDSGGFQIRSLLQRNPSLGKINDEGITFRLDSLGQSKKILFTPEMCIQAQFILGSDIVICLDDFTPAIASTKECEITAKRTIEWAKRCKNEYARQIEKRKLAKEKHPLLIAVIQGGHNQKIRAWCAEELVSIGFDGFGLGGWLHDQEGKLDLQTIELNAQSTPNNLPRFALGIGDPQCIVDCFKLGYQIFDCVLPTRDARHGRLYTFIKDPIKMDLMNEEKVHRFIYIKQGKYKKDFTPVSEFCDCPACQKYPRAYLWHLFKIRDSLAGRLATLHNLRVYTRLVGLLREEGNQPVSSAV